MSTATQMDGFYFDAWYKQIISITVYSVPCGIPGMSSDITW